jgi:hypothetical protein
LKTYKHLYPQICAFDNLYDAYRSARRGKRDKKQVFRFEFNAESELVRLQDELTAKTNQPGSYTNFRLNDRKRRLISAAPFRDRVVHHALCRVTMPLFERRFIHDSYANQLGKGTHRALDRAQAFARKYRYVLQGDIVQFFPSIDHAVLRGMLARHIADDDTLWLIDRILASGAEIHRQQYVMQWFPGDDLFAAQLSPAVSTADESWSRAFHLSSDQPMLELRGACARERRAAVTDCPPLLPPWTNANASSSSTTTRS